jgi:hypothetical protein
MQVSSSMTMVPAEPSALPAFCRLSRSMFTSISSGRRTGVDDPPGITAFNFFPPRMPRA